MDTNGKEFPKYQSHKIVHAIKIQSLVYRSDGNAEVWPDEEGYTAILVDAAYITKHNPQVGGYFVIYEDGYQSFSPAEAFEAGYTKID